MFENASKDLSSTKYHEQIKSTQFLSILAHGLKSNGFHRFHFSDIILNTNENRHLNEINQYAYELPADDYDAHGTRKRAYGRYIYLPWRESQDCLYATPGRFHETKGAHVITFQQPKTLNHEENGNYRLFTPLPDHVYENPFLKQIVANMFWSLPFDFTLMEFPFQVGIHIVKLEATPNTMARASPDCVHRDGEPYTFAILLNSENALGGENYITDPDWQNNDIDNIPYSAIRDRFKLENPGDGYVVSDRDVAHYVSPVFSRNGISPGIRTVLLIDYTPMRPQLVV